MNSKIVSRDEAVKRVEALRKGGKKIGYTSGVFDLLHPGHVDYLEKAKNLCDVLVVGLNSDASVKTYKSEDRPIVSENDRARVLSALGSVDLIFIFDDTNNNKNVELLKPDVYVKAGDYTKDKLSSASIVEKNGGRVEIVPSFPGYSTTSILDRIKHIDLLHSFISLPSGPRCAAVFLDRDGTINEHIDYLHEREKFRLNPNALEGMKILKDLGFKLVVVTNQPGIGLGYFTKEDMFSVNHHFLRMAGKAGVMIDRIYYCPHSAAASCECRKPGIELLNRAANDLNIDLAASFVVGDMTSDVQLGKNAGCKTVLVKTGKGGTDGICQAAPDYTANDLLDAASWIEKNRIPVTEVERYEDFQEYALSSDALEAIGKICGKIGHDFNNLLGSMMGCMDLIKSKTEKLFPENNPMERQIKIVQAAITRSTELTSKIRGYVRSGPMARNEGHLSMCLQTVVGFLNKNQLTVPVEVLLEVRADPPVQYNDFVVGQMLMGMVSNSIDAMKKQKERSIVLYLDRVEIGEGKVEGLSKGTYAQVSIIDHGEGLSAEELQNLYRPFTSTKSGIGEGMGLGLVMAQEIMRRHDGTLEIRSLPDVGTAVNLYFPVRVK